MSREALSTILTRAGLNECNMRFFQAILRNVVERNPLRISNETYVPAFRNSSQAYTRLSGPHENTRGPRGNQCSTRQGPPPFGGVSLFDKTFCFCPSPAPAQRGRVFRGLCSSTKFALKVLPGAEPAQSAGVSSLGYRGGQAPVWASCRSQSRSEGHT
jgi:hypothetical protein